MRIILHYMPNCVERVPRGGCMLDVGSGPTVHMAFCFRNRVSEIYLSDYNEANRQELNRWWQHQSTFDWSDVTKWIAQNEGIPDKWHEIEEQARSKLRGVLPCNVFNQNVIDSPVQLAPFDLVTSIFCIEFASFTSDEYHQVQKNTLFISVFIQNTVLLL